MRSISTAFSTSSRNSSNAATTTIMTIMSTAHAHDHGGLAHYHDEDMQSLALSTDKAIDPDKFFPWIQNLVAQEGPKILRSKGILAFKDDPQRFVFQGVHMMLDGDHQREWKDAEKRESRLVFIGRELPETMIRKGFEECAA